MCCAMFNSRRESSSVSAWRTSASLYLLVRARYFSIRHICNSLDDGFRYFRNVTSLCQCRSNSFNSVWCFTLHCSILYSVSASKSSSSRCQLRVSVHTKTSRSFVSCEGQRKKKNKLFVLAFPLFQISSPRRVTSDPIVRSMVVRIECVIVKRLGATRLRIVALGRNCAYVLL